ncbi:MAG: ABC transporter ATP-binding protein [Verrucomicrobia bacterium]|nr:ABC transporter ATP-binding protein [Verrucomicrobiota bacterium]MBS0637605.1 ABC transporter ATP-binding protein [Verrucomicrobiota bacterium]
MSNTILQADNITKRFEHPAPLELLKGISLEVHRGQSVAIVGKSGEGKTTLLHILGTLDEPTEGSLSLLGKTVDPSNRNHFRNKHLGFVFQAFHLLDDATVLENILMPLAIARQDIKKGSANYELAVDLLNRLGLYERRFLSALKLSGGEKQRLGIGRAFITNPDIILADEPTGNLDHQTAAEIQDLLFSWVKQEGKALIAVTHSYELAKRSDVIYTLDSGYLIQNT